MKIYAVFFLLCLPLTGCYALAYSATSAALAPDPTGYRAADAGGYGYTEFVRADGSIQVTYRGNYRTTVADAELYVLCRAAAVSASLGKPYFAIIDQQTRDGAAQSMTSCGPGMCATNTRATSPVVVLLVQPMERIDDARVTTYPARPEGSFADCKPHS